MHACNTYPMYYIYFLISELNTRPSRFHYIFFPSVVLVVYMYIVLIFIILCRLRAFFYSASLPSPLSRWRTKPRGKRKRLLHHTPPHAQVWYRVYEYFFCDHLFFFYIFRLTHSTSLEENDAPVIYIIIYCTHSGKNFFSFSNKHTPCGVLRLKSNMF